jgi:hypothetical protein
MRNNKALQIPLAAAPVRHTRAGAVCYVQLRGRLARLLFAHREGQLAAVVDLKCSSVQRAVQNRRVDYVLLRRRS